MHPTTSNNHSNYSDYSNYSDWEGTLSAALLRSLNYLRQAVSSKNNNNNNNNNNNSLLSNIFLLFKSSSNPTTTQVWFGLLCALWYSSSALSSNTGKIILNQFTFPVTLTIIQFGFVAVWSGLFLILRHHLHSFRIHGGLGYLNLHQAGFLDSLGIRLPNRSTIRGTCIMSLFSIAGHVFSSMAISRVPVSTVHTIKALSPLFTVIAYAGLFGVRYGLNTYFSLLPLTLGVMLACSFDMRANGIGFLCALGSTVIFVSQNIFGKKLLPNNNSSSSNNQTHRRSLSASTGGVVQMDKLNLLFYSSAIAFLMMIPIWMYADLSALLWMDPTTSRSTGTKGKLNSSSIGLTGYFIFNGTVHFAQCILAFSILSRTSPVTYSIASLFKRVAVICIAIIWFGQKVSLLQAFGMILTFIGLYIYNQSKSEIDRGEKRRGILERKNDLLFSLPSTSSDVKNLQESEQILNLHASEEKIHHHHQSVRFENPFRRESLQATSVHLSPKPHHHQLHQTLSSEGHANSSGRGIDRSSVVTRQRAPSIPTSFSFSSSSSIHPNNNPNIHHNHHHHHHHPTTTSFYSSNQQQQQQQQPTTTTTTTSNQLSSIPFNHHHSNANTALNPSPLVQESNPFRSIVNVR